MILSGHQWTETEDLIIREPQTVLIRTTLPGGARREKPEPKDTHRISVLFQNINGLHAQGQNLHKLKANNRLSDKESPDLQVYIETGVNSSKKAIPPTDSLVIDVENPIPKGC